MALLRGGGLLSAVLVVSLLVSVGSAIWIGVDQPRVRRRYGASRVGTMATGWVLGALLVWILAVPWYLVRRSQQVSAAAGQVVCPECGAFVAPRDAFCPECGADVSGSAESEPACPACGHELRRGVTFCPSCGQELP